MNLLFGFFLIKRPEKSVLERSKEYEETGDLSKMTEIYMDKKRCVKYGFEDGYLKCLQDLGINHTINGYSGKCSLSNKKLNWKRMCGVGKK
jgi:hypothetical protein